MKIEYRPEEVVLEIPEGARYISWDSANNISFWDELPKPNHLYHEEIEDGIGWEHPVIEEYYDPDRESRYMELYTHIYHIPPPHHANERFRLFEITQDWELVWIGHQFTDADCDIPVQYDGD